MNTKGHFVEPCSHRVSTSAVCHILYIHHRSHEGPLFLRILAHSSSTESFFYPKLTFLGTTKSFESETPVRSISGSQTDKLEQNSEVKRALWAGFYTYACTHAHTEFLCAYFVSTVWPSLASFVASLDKKCDLHDVTSLIKIWLCIAVLCWLYCRIFSSVRKAFTSW